MPYMITPTLLDAGDFFMKCPPSWKDRAFEGLKSKIERTPFEPTPAIKRGIEFETAIQDVVERSMSSGKPVEECLSGSPEFYQVARICHGGTFQVWGQSVLDVEGYGTAKCYGKIDVLFPVTSARHPSGLIIDLKTTASYKGPQKYLSGWQHIFYSAFFLIPDFQYVVAEWADPEASAIKAVHIVETTVDPSRASESMRAGIDRFFNMLKCVGLWDSYRAIYCKMG